MLMQQQYNSNINRLIEQCWRTMLIIAVWVIKLNHHLLDRPCVAMASTDHLYELGTSSRWMSSRVWMSHSWSDDDDDGWGWAWASRACSVRVASNPYTCSLDSSVVPSRMVWAKIVCDCVDQPTDAPTQSCTPPKKIHWKYHQHHQHL